MKKLTTVCAAFLLVMAGCGGGSQQSEDMSDALVTIDVKTKYPKKDFVLQDFYDVEYVPLETNDEFICEGHPLAIGEKIIIVRNSANGDIFIFDRKNGKGIKKINRHGESGEEYVYNYNAFLDEDKGELFICDRKIMVYDLEGNFKRSFDRKEDAALQDLTNFDGESFIWWNAAFSFDIDNRAVDMPSFFITSKQDGRIIREIEIPIEKRKSPIIIWREGEMVYSIGPHNKTVIPFKEEMILSEASSDTVYRYTRDHQLIPLIVRTPSLQTMDPEMFLFPGAVTDRYLFMDINTKERDSKDISLMHDRKTGETFQSTVCNGDFSTKRPVAMYSYGKNGNPNVAFCQPIHAETLVSANEKGQLKGQLKEIAANLDEESNVVIMIAKYKK